MEKLDLTKVHRSYYTAKAKPQLEEIEAAQFLSLTGKGDPSSESYLQSLQALYGTAYAIKFAFKAQGKDFTVAKLEGQWWFDMDKYKVTSLDEAPQQIPRSEWEWRMLIRMPRYVKAADVNAAIATAYQKKKEETIKSVELYNMEEGLVVQMLHLGPFDTEPESLKLMDDYMKANKLERAGLHHEIYLSDFRKVSPDKLRTILREPVKRMTN